MGCFELEVYCCTLGALVGAWRLGGLEHWGCSSAHMEDVSVDLSVCNV